MSAVRNGVADRGQEFTPETVVSSQMRDAVGRELCRQTSYPVSESDIRRWAVAVYYPEPPPRRYIDAVAGQALVAPEEFNPFAWLVAAQQQRQITNELTDPDRTEALVGVVGPGLRFMLNGGIEVEYGEPIRAGDVITAVSRLKGYHERSGRLGPMLFTVTEETWTNQNDAFVKVIRKTLIRY
jgi:hypothetical protein